MSNILLIQFFIFSISFLSQPNFELSSWEYKEYAKLTNTSGTLFKLEFGVKKNGYNGEVKWRLTNMSNKPVYNARIGKKAYTLKNGKIVKRLGESFANNQIDPGEIVTTYPDPVNSDENYGSWSDKNDNPVISIQLESPMIEFWLSKTGDNVGWAKLGTVKM